MVNDQCQPIWPDDDSALTCVDIPLDDAFLDPDDLDIWLPQLVQYFATNSAAKDSRCLQPDSARDWATRPWAALVRSLHTVTSRSHTPIHTQRVLGSTAD